MQQSWEEERVREGGRGGEGRGGEGRGGEERGGEGKGGGCANSSPTEQCTCMSAVFMHMFHASVCLTMTITSSAISLF